MREQVIAPRVNARGASARERSGGYAQKPARRESRGRSAVQSRGNHLRTALRYVPLIGKILLAIAAGLILFAGYRAAAAASFFTVRHVDVNATQHTSAAEVDAVVRRLAADKGVWRADLAQISAELEKLPWVRTAVVSRVLPDGLRVRLIERTPRAVVRLDDGRFVWVDEDAVGLGQVLPAEQADNFIIRGWDEAGTMEARRANRERMAAYLEMANEWGTLNLSSRVSEVNLGDLRDVRAQLAGDDARIEVRLGGESFGPRLQKALAVLDERRSADSSQYIVTLDATSKKNTIIGYKPGATSPVEREESSVESDTAAVAPKPESNAPSPRTNAPLPRPTTESSRGAKPKSARPPEKTKKKQKPAAEREKPAREAKQETRPRRVG